MNTYLILSSFILFMLYNNKSTNININNIKEITKKISICRPVESSNLILVKNIIIKYIKDIPGFTVKLQKFTRIIYNKSYSFSNIIASNTNKNKNLTEILLTAHIDSKNIDGAIDSATSIALIIELIRKIINIYPDYPISIVLFDGEEAIDGKWSTENTLSGSTYFVNKLKSNKNMLVFVFDLIGGSIKNNKIYPFASNISSLPILNELVKINKHLYPEQMIFNNIISSRIISDDHLPFMNNNIPFVHIIPDVFPKQHHKIEDNYNNINWTYIDIFGNVFLTYLLKKSIF